MHTVTDSDWGYSIDPHAYPVTLWARTRRLLAGNVRMGVMSGDTGKPHGPVQWLEPEPPAVPAHHESQRLFAPVDVMPGQLSIQEQAGAEYGRLARGV